MADAPEYRAPAQGLEPVHQYSTLEYNPHGNQDVNGYYGSVKSEGASSEAGADTPIKGENDARLCGMKRKTAIILGALILLLVVVGAVAGGVVGSKASRTSKPPTDAESDKASSASSAIPEAPSASTGSSTSTSSSATSTPSAPIILIKDEIFDSLKFHTISTYYGSSSSITRNTSEASKNEREFFSIIGSFPAGGTVGNVGIVGFQPQFDDQRWHIMPAKSSQVPDAVRYGKYKRPLNLLLITCQRYGQTVRLALDGTTPDATLSLAKQDDQAANQFWYTEQIEADIEGEYGRYALKNYEAGDDWHLGMTGVVSDFGKMEAPLLEGKPKSDIELWQIMPREWLNETERAQWGTVV